MSMPSSQERTTTDLPSADADRPPAPPGASRRVFLAGTGAIALGATAAATTIDGLTAHVARTAASGGTEGVAVTQLEAGTLVAYIRPGESEITIMTGDREVVIDDPALARAIARAGTRQAGTR